MRQICHPSVLPVLQHAKDLTTPWWEHNVWCFTLVEAIRLPVQKRPLALAHLTSLAEIQAPVIVLALIAHIKGTKRHSNAVWLPLSCVWCLWCGQSGLKQLQTFEFHGEPKPVYEAPPWGPLPVMFSWAECFLLPAL